VSSLSEFIAYARANPGRVTVATQGTGTTGHLAGLQFSSLGKLDLSFVPYKGTAPALTDLMGGQVDAFFDVLTSARSAHDAGKVRILAVSGARRAELLPAIPTFAEQGMPGFTISTWFALMAPKGLPPELARRVHADVVSVLRRDDVRQQLKDASAEVSGMSLKETADFIEQERVRSKGFIEAANISLD
jgi:tripartite-type tricarboxylate transporter receptor subunit TctC